MTKLNKDNLEEFLKYYHAFHDSSIASINYSIFESCIELIINVFWSGKPILKEDKSYETNKVKLKMIFNEVEKFNSKEIFSWDEIYDAFIDFIHLDGKEYICFASDEEEPFIYIVCNNIEYEEIN